MIIKFNKFERVAGIFVISAVMGGVAFGVGVAVKKGWFESKRNLITHLDSADGIHVGTQVEMSGLRIGSVVDIELKSTTLVEVRFQISEKYFARVHQDSALQLIRPFIIGEKVLDLSSGTDASPSIRDGGLVQVRESIDFMDLLSGRKLGPYLSSMGKITDNLKSVAETIMDQKHLDAFVKMFTELNPLVTNMSQMSSQANVLLKELNKKQQLIIALNNLVELTTQLNKALPYLTEQGPALAEDMTKIAHNMARLTDQMQALSPVLKELAPEIPHAGRRAIEALNETVITLKALQKSFLLRSNVREVKEDEAKERMPATDKNSKPRE